MTRTPAVVDGQGRCCVRQESIQARSGARTMKAVMRSQLDQSEPLALPSWTCCRRRWGIARSCCSPSLRYDVAAGMMIPTRAWRSH